MSAGSRFGFTNLTTGIVSTGTSSYPSTKRVRLSDAAGATGLSLLSEASAPSDYKLRTVLGVDGVTTTVAGDSIQMSAGALAARVAALDLVVLKKSQLLNLYQTEADLDPAVIRTFPDTRDVLIQPKAMGNVLIGSEISAKAMVNGHETYVALGSGLVSQNATIDTNRTTQDAVNFTTTTRIAAEEKRAIAAELALGVRLTTETDRALYEEKALAAGLAYNVSQDALLVTSVNTETSNRIAADTALTGNLNFEKSRALSAEGILTANLSTEIARAINQEGILDNAQLAENTRAVLAEGVLSTLVTNLTTRVSTEETTRAYQIASASAALTVEINARIAAVNTVTASLDTKYNLIDTAFGNFVAVATSRDEYLLQRVDFIMKNTDSAAIDSLSELINRQNVEAITLYSRLQMLEDIVSTLKGSPIYTATNPRAEFLGPMVGPDQLVVP